MERAAEAGEDAVGGGGGAGGGWGKEGWRCSAESGGGGGDGEVDGEEEGEDGEHVVARLTVREWSRTGIWRDRCRSGSSVSVCGSWWLYTGTLDGMKYVDSWRCGIEDILRSNKIPLMKAAEEGCLSSGVLKSMSFW